MPEKGGGKNLIALVPGVEELGNEDITVLPSSEAC